MNQEIYHINPDLRENYLSKSQVITSFGSRLWQNIRLGASCFDDVIHNIIFSEEPSAKDELEQAVFKNSLGYFSYVGVDTLSKSFDISRKHLEEIANHEYSFFPEEPEPDSIQILLKGFIEYLKDKKSFLENKAPEKISSSYLRKKGILISDYLDPIEIDAQEYNHTYSKEDVVRFCNSVLLDLHKAALNWDGQQLEIKPMLYQRFASNYFVEPRDLPSIIPKHPEKTLDSYVYMVRQYAHKVPTKAMHVLNAMKIQNIRRNILSKLIHDEDFFSLVNNTLLSTLLGKAEDSLEDMVILDKTSLDIASVVQNELLRTQPEMINKITFTAKYYSKFIEGYESIIKNRFFERLLSSDAFVELIANDLYQEPLVNYMSMVVFSEDIKQNNHKRNHYKFHRKLKLRLLRFRKVIDIPEIDIELRNPLFNSKKISNLYKDPSRLSRSSQLKWLRKIFSSVAFRDEYRKKLINWFKEKNPVEFKEFQTDILDVEKDLKLLNDEIYKSFVLSNMRLNMFVANKYRFIAQNLSLTSLVHDGITGLFKATQRWDYERGYAFSTYATWWVRQSITRAIADQDKTIRHPVHISEGLARLRRAEEQLLMYGGEVPTLEELSEKTDFSVKKVIKLKKLSNPTISLSTTVGEDGTEIINFIASGKDVNKDAIARCDYDTFMNFLDGLGLPEREKDVFLKRFREQDKKTLEEIGAHYQVTRERIRQIQKKVVKKIKKYKPNFV